MEIYSDNDLNGMTTKRLCEVAGELALIQARINTVLINRGDF